MAYGYKRRSAQYRNGYANNGGKQYRERSRSGYGKRRARTRGEYGYKSGRVMRQSRRNSNRYYDGGVTL